MKATFNYVLINKAAELTGYSRLAIEAKIAKGQWLEGREYVIAPDGHRLISLAGVTAWIEHGGRKPGTTHDRGETR